MYISNPISINNIIANVVPYYNANEISECFTQHALYIHTRFLHMYRMFKFNSKIYLTLEQ